MAEKIDTASMMKQNTLYVKIDELDEKLYATIEEKKIQINSLQDIERVERFFNPLIKEIIKLIEADRSLQGPLKALIRSRVILDFHGNFAEKYKLDMLGVVGKLGSYNIKIVEKAMSDIKQLM